MASQSFSPPDINLNGSNSLTSGDSNNSFENYDGAGNGFHFLPGRSGTNFVAGTTTGLQPSLISSSWQADQPSPLNATHAQNHAAELSLGQLLIMYPIVQELHNSLAVANLRLSLAVETQAALVKENMRLSSELREAVASPGHGYDQ